MVSDPRFFDLSPGRRKISPESVSLALSRAFRWAREPEQRARYDAGADPERFDSGGDVFTADLIDAWYRHTDSVILDHLSERQQPLPGWQLDAADRYYEAHEDAEAGGSPRDFEHVRAQIFEERHEPLSAMAMFPIDSSVPLGARTHTVRRATSSGEAKIYRSDEGIPRAKVAFSEERFRTAVIVCAVDQDYFDAMATDRAGLQVYQRELRTARDLVKRKMNRIAWFGDNKAGLYGVLNYPHIAKQVFPVAINAAANPELIALGLVDLVNTPMVRSGTAFNANRLGLSPRQYAFIASRKHAAGTDTTILQYVLNVLGWSRDQIKMVPELKDAGGAGIDGILAYRAELAAIGHVVIQDATTLPVYDSSPIEQTTVVFGVTGGMVMPEVGNHVVALALN